MKKAQYNLKSFKSKPPEISDTESNTLHVSRLCPIFAGITDYLNSDEIRRSMFPSKGKN